MLHFIWPATLFLLLYTIRLIRYKKSWIQSKTFGGGPKGQTLVEVDIIIAFRNEWHNLPTLIEGLKKQDYPKQLLRFILVDDHSTDGSLALAKNIAGDDGQFRIFSLDMTGQGKKEALTAGLQHAKGKVVLFSDADCLHPETWVSTMVNEYMASETDMLLGPVAFMDQPGFIAQFARFEFAGLMGATCASANLGSPALSNGANLLVKREIINQLANPFNNRFSSGDDMFLLDRVKNGKTKKIRFAKSREALVLTHPPGTLKAFVDQRLRWVSKNKGLGNSKTMLDGLIVLALSTMLVALAAASVFWPVLRVYFFAIFLLKTLTDIWFVAPVFKFIGKPGPRLKVFSFGIFNLFYVPIIAIWGNWAKFEWKNRKLKR
jgi:cellulose synthase/poly-beta-1,6-N-acetylglucosamine synthase-like glycosyltransferase